MRAPLTMKLFWRASGCAYQGTRFLKGSNFSYTIGHLRSEVNEGSITMQSLTSFNYSIKGFQHYWKQVEPAHYHKTMAAYSNGLDEVLLCAGCFWAYMTSCVKY